MIKRYKQNEIDELAEILKNDGVICVPTDTVYGLCARINSTKAHDRLMAIKSRPLEKAFPIMCANLEQIKSIAVINEKAEKLINAFMPGSLTILVNVKKNSVPAYVTHDTNIIGIRIPIFMSNRI